jgi:integrase
MPLKLVPPRPGNPNWQIRGSYLHVKRLYRSAGTPERRIAEQALKKLKRDIESGAFAAEAGPTFAGAVTSYLRAGGESYPLRKLLEYFQTTLLADIDQAAIDAAADALFPVERYSPATRNRQVYCPISAILKHAGIETKLRRPKGGRGKRRLHWLRPEPLLDLLAAAEAIDVRFGAFCKFLFYVGARRSEGLLLEWNDVDLAAGSAFCRTTKNGDPRTCFLPPELVATLANLPRVAGDDRVFRLCANNQLAAMLDKASQISGVPIPDGIAFHIFRHSYGAQMRRIAGLDTSGLVATGAWKSPEAARVYEHTEFSEEATKAVLLPTRQSVRKT